MSKVRYGCSFHSEHLIVIQISEEMAGNEKLARELKTVIEKENIRRSYHGESKIAYKIVTSEKLAEQFPDVAAGEFKLVDDRSAVQSVDLGQIFFASNPVGGED